VAGEVGLGRLEVREGPNSAPLTVSRQITRSKSSVPARRIPISLVLVADDPLATAGVTTLAEAADCPWFPTSQCRYRRDGGEARSTDRCGAECRKLFSRNSPTFSLYHGNPQRSSARLSVSLLNVSSLFRRQ
jgi:hypothetical protein